MKNLAREVTACGPLALASGLLIVFGAFGCGGKAAKAPPAPATPPPAPVTSAEPAPRTDTGAQTRGLTSEDLSPAFFDYDAYTLREDAKAALDHAARLLRTQSDVRITIEGHCDERGTIEYNQALGEKRGQAARAYLLSAGVADSRMVVVSHGKERPFDHGHDEAAWAKNRRAHLVVR